MTSIPESEAVEVVEKSGTALCNICGKPQNNHPYRHAFSAPGRNPILHEINEEVESHRASSSSTPASQGRSGRPASIDPVLRLILLRKGVISVADLDALEEELRVTGAAGFEPPRSLG